MHDPRAHHREPSASERVIGSELHVAPSSSRMLASYLTDVEQLLDGQRWEAALREALDLPQIAVALSDPALCSSGEGIQTWCQSWIRPLETESGAELDVDSVCRMVREHLQSNEARGARAVPTAALRRLRLRRLARTRTAGFGAERAASTTTEQARVIDVCTSLIEAVRRWYAHSACHDPTVQANLARLAVLR
jgi:hypothetical protein